MRTWPRPSPRTCVQRSNSLHIRSTDLLSVVPFNEHNHIRSFEQPSNGMFRRKCSYSIETDVHLDGEDCNASPASLVSDLKGCAERKDLHKGSAIHCAIARKGEHRANVFLGSALVNMYAKCGAVWKAQEVFNALQEKNTILWNALISGYVQQGLDRIALSCFEQMQLEGFSPDAVTFTCVLKCSGSIKFLDKGQEVHDHVVKFGLLDCDIFVGTALVDMYAKCGALEETQAVFDKLPNQNLVSWSALIAGYAQQGFGEKAIDCYKKMELKGFHADAAIYVSLFKSCGMVGALDTGQDLLTNVVKDELLQLEKIGGAVVDMYIKCGSLEKAKEVFDELLVRNEVTWNALMGGFEQEGSIEEVFKSFTRMLCEGVCPDGVTYSCMCKGSPTIGAVNMGKTVHAQIVGDGFLEKEIVTGTSLVDMYGKFGLMEQAQEVFNRLEARNVVSWTALIGGYADLGQCKAALDCYLQMQLGGLYPNVGTFACILKACGSVGALLEGQEIHAQIVKSGMMAEVILGTSLLNMYTKCGMFKKGLEVFEDLPVHDVIAWNGLIAGYTELGNGQKAIESFNILQSRGLSPNAATLSCILRACSSSPGLAEKSNDIISQILKDKKHIIKDAVIVNALLKALIHHGFFAKAQEVFDELPNRDVVSWNALLTGYIQHGHDDEAFQCFEQMKGERAFQDSITFSSVLKACGRLEAGHKGKEIHAQILRQWTLLESDVVVGTALVDMYSKCGMLAEALKVFCGLPVRDPPSWNALITGYAQHGRYEDALHCFQSMQANGLDPTSITFTCILKACGSLGALQKGQEIHDRFLRAGSQQVESIVGNALVDMYANCGMVTEAQSVFDRLGVQDLISWNCLIAGCAQLGASHDVFNMFDKLVVEAKKPDVITFIYMLNACSHLGLLDTAQIILETMNTIYDAYPCLEHLNCMIDCLGRAGCLDKIALLVCKMPIPPNLLMWHTVLGACQNHCHVDLGKQAFENALELDNHNVAAYVCVHNILRTVARSPQDISNIAG